MANTVSRNMPTAMKAKVGSLMSDLMLAAPPPAGMPMLRKP